MSSPLSSPLERPTSQSVPETGQKMTGTSQDLHSFDVKHALENQTELTKSYDNITATPLKENDLSFDNILEKHEVDQAPIQHLDVEHLQHTLQTEPLETPHMHQTLLAVRAGLQRSETAPTLPERMRFMPSIPGEKGVGGSYFAYGETPSHEIKPLLVIKPSIQEPGAPGNDEASLGVGIKGGEGCIRERMAWSLQNALHLPLGVPETALTTFSHEMFGMPLGTNAALQKLSVALNTPLTRQEFIKLGGLEPPESFLQKIRDKNLELLKNELPSSEHFEMALALAAKGYPKLPRSMLKETLEEQIGEHPHMKSIVKIVAAHWSLNNNPALAKHTAEIKTSLETIHPAQNESLASAQLLIPHCVSLGSLTDEEAEMIPPTEYQKLVLDLISINTDRHLGNVLASKTSVASLKERLGFTQDPAEKERLSEIIQFAGSKSHVYEFVLIDHGSCFPDPSLLQRGQFPSPRLDWSDQPAAEQPVTGKMRERILAMNPAQIVARVQKDQQMHAQKFGAEAQVSDATYRLTELNLHILKGGVKAGMTLQQMANFLSGVKMKGYEALYNQHILEGKPITPEEIDKILQNLRDKL